MHTYLFLQDLQGRVGVPPSSVRTKVTILKERIFDNEWGTVNSIKFFSDDCKLIFKLENTKVESFIKIGKIDINFSCFMASYSGKAREDKK